jgi:hypothetical protein
VFRNDPGSSAASFAAYSVRVKISEKVKRLLRKEPPTDEELGALAEARAQAAALRAQRASDAGEVDLQTRRPG